MTSRARWTLPLVVLLLDACSDPPSEVMASSGDSTTSTTEGPPPSTSTTTSGEGSVGTMGATGMETTMGDVDTTAGVSATDGTTTVDPPSTTSSGESSGPPPVMCTEDDECASNEVCDTGTCVGACNGIWGTGAWGDCLGDLGGLDAFNVCGPDTTCIVDGFPWNVTACSMQTCKSACDCPAPPVTGNATVTCGDIADQGSTTDCLLSCAEGEACPDGMECLPDGMGNPFLCVVPVPASVPMYGNCDDLAGVTCTGGSCGIAGPASVCTEGCANAEGCDPGPPGTMAPQCADVFDPPGGTECFLPCMDATDCPLGAQCIDVPGPTNACMF